MGAKAALAAMEQAGITGEEIDLILVATATPTWYFRPRPASSRQRSARTSAACLDISAACAGFLFAVEIAQQFIHLAHLRHRARDRRGETDHDHRLDRAQYLCPFRGRRAARPFCAIATAASHGLISTHIASDGKFRRTSFGCPGGGSRHPITRENVDDHLQTIKMSGKEVYKQAVTAMVDAAQKAPG